MGFKAPTAKAADYICVNSQYLYPQQVLRFTVIWEIAEVLGCRPEASAVFARAHGISILLYVWVQGFRDVQPPLGMICFFFSFQMRQA